MSERLDRMEKMLEWLLKSQKETSEQIKKTEQTLKWMWLTQWKISEEIIYDNFKNVFKEEWEEINSIENNITVYNNRKKVAEFDIIWVNGNKVFITETKTKLTKENIDEMIEEKIPKFKKYLHKQRFGWLEIYGVMWARVFWNKKVKDYAKKKWLYLIKEYHNWNARILKESLKTVKSF